MTIRFKGVSAEVQGNPDDEIVRKFWANGQFYEARPGELLDWLSEQKGGVFFDVGANLCNHTLYALLSGNFQRAVCIEPDDGNADACVKNLIANVWAERWEVVRCALSSKAGKGRMAGMENGERNSGMKTLVPGVGPVNMRTLDSFTSACDVLKIDVEGHERQVLQGGLKFIARTRPKIAIEVMDEQFTEVDAQLDGMGYAQVLRLTNRTPTYIYEISCSAANKLHGQFARTA